MTRSFREWFLDQLGMYAAYHTDRRNQLTHYIGVPLIIFSLLLGLTAVYIGSPLFSMAGFLLGLLLLAYIVAVPAVGILSVLLYTPLLVLAIVATDLPDSQRWGLVAACFVGGWVIQFAGHVFEGRKPAFIANILQLFMAPAFLAAELMFVAGFQKQLAAKLDAQARKYAAS